MTSTSLRLAYLTAGSQAEALKIARDLIERRLAACVNVLGAATSVYRWQDEVQEDGEVIFVAKTREELVPALVERVKALHSYDCPCVVTLPLGAGNAAFLDWVAEETAPASAT